MVNIRVMQACFLVVVLATLSVRAQENSCIQEEMYSEWLCKKKCETEYSVTDLTQAVWLSSPDSSQCNCAGQIACIGSRVCQSVTMVSTGQEPKSFSLRINAGCHGRPVYERVPCTSCRADLSVFFMPSSVALSSTLPGPLDYWVVGSSVCSTSGLEFRTAVQTELQAQLPDKGAQWDSRDLGWGVDDKVQLFCSDSFSPPAPLSARPTPSPVWKLPEAKKSSSGPSAEDKLLLGFAIVLTVLCVCTISFAVYWFCIRNPGSSMPKWTGDIGLPTNPYVMGMYNKTTTTVKSMNGNPATQIELAQLQTNHERSDMDAPVVLDPHGFKVMDNPLSRFDQAIVNPNAEDLQIEDSQPEP
mmetsp:Transcript_2494/g.3443  ORF Transcript_2494/g.3443 Transcript_2494/m.3443 type:complete len:357 (-) Transcript_2494:18-1088(-)